MKKAEKRSTFQTSNDMSGTVVLSGLLFDLPAWSTPQHISHQDIV
jgi:hypothetical protein